MQESAERNTVVFKSEYRKQSEVINPAHVTDRESNSKNICFIVKRLEASRDNANAEGSDSYISLG